MASLSRRHAESQEQFQCIRVPEEDEEEEDGVGGGSEGNDFYYFASKGLLIAAAAASQQQQQQQQDPADSGLSSDQEGFTPPPLLRRRDAAAAAAATAAANKKMSSSTSSFSDSLVGDDSQSDVGSADSLADSTITASSNHHNGTEVTSLASSHGTISPTTGQRRHGHTVVKKLPSNLLNEIRLKAAQIQQQSSARALEQQQQQQQQQQIIKQQQQQQQPIRKSPAQRRIVSPSSLSSASSPSVSHHKNKQQQVHHQHQQQQKQQQHLSLDADLFSRFHMHENLSLPDEAGTHNSNSLNSPTTSPSALPSASDDLSFVGLKDILSVEKGNTIRSHKSGTVRGVRNRVRAGITTFLQAKTFKSYAEREHGKVVVYTTSMGVVRETFQRCLQVQRILGTLLIAYEERDVSMNRQVQQELKERVQRDTVLVPQVFVEGQLLGDADVVEKLNESGDLRRILRRYKRVGPETICDACGGFRYLPCTVCCGSKKSVHRNHLVSASNIVTLKCITCNEAGLVRCSLCNHKDA